MEQASFLCRLTLCMISVKGTVRYTMVPERFSTFAGVSERVYGGLQDIVS